MRIPESGLEQVGQVRDWMPRTFDTLDPATLPQVTEVLTTIADALRTVAAQIHASEPTTRTTRSPFVRARAATASSNAVFPTPGSPSRSSAVPSFSTSPSIASRA